MSLSEEPTEMQEVHFTKMSGAGNDFIVIDNRDGAIAADGRGALFAEWCRRRLGVGNGRRD